MGYFLICITKKSIIISEFILTPPTKVPKKVVKIAISEKFFICYPGPCSIISKCCGDWFKRPSWIHRLSETNSYENCKTKIKGLSQAAGICQIWRKNLLRVVKICSSFLLVMLSLTLGIYGRNIIMTHDAFLDFLNRHTTILL